MKSKFLLFVAVALVLGVGLRSYVHRQTSHQVAADRKMTVDIGAYPNIEAEQRTSLERLSLELHQHPQLDAVRVTAGKSAWRGGVMGFIRSSSPVNKNVFWYDDRFSSPVFGNVKGRSQGIHAMVLVSEEPIHVIAHGTGSAADVLPYNQHLRVQIGIGKPNATTPVKIMQHQQ